MWRRCNASYSGLQDGTVHVVELRLLCHEAMSACAFFSPVKKAEVRASDRIEMPTTWFCVFAAVRNR